MNIHTADLCDENQDKEIKVLPSKFKNYGGLKRFYGQIETIKLDKSNWRLLEMLRDECFSLAFTLLLRLETMKLWVVSLLRDGCFSMVSSLL